MDIRTALPGDQAGIRRYDRYIPEERLAACIRDGFVLVLCDANSVIGVFRWSLFWQSIPFLDLILIDEAYQGQGLGRNMMHFWEKAIARRDYRHVMLSTQEDEDAQYFYDHLGYRRCGGFFPPDQEAEELMFLKILEV